MTVSNQLTPEYVDAERGGSAPKVSLRGISKAFMVKRQVVNALAGIDVDIRPGEFFCVVGPSGCGKTTLLRILAGLEPQDGGSVRIARDRTDARNGASSGVASLDEQTKLILQGELLRIWEDDRKTVVYVTHSIDEAIVLADRIMIMTARPGRIKDIVDVAAVFGRPRELEAVRSSPSYGEMFGHIWSQLRTEVTESRDGDINANTAR